MNAERWRIGVLYTAGNLPTVQQCQYLCCTVKYISTAKDCALALSEKTSQRDVPPTFTTGKRAMLGSFREFFPTWKFGNWKSYSNALISQFPPCIPVRRFWKFLTDNQLRGGGVLGTKARSVVLARFRRICNR